MMLEENQAMREMPRYRCHKEVWALKIKRIIPIDHSPCVHPYGATTCGFGPYEAMHYGSLKAKPPLGRHEYQPEGGFTSQGAAFIEPEDEGYAAFPVSAEYLEKHKPQVGGYIVSYKDGYKSFSPAEAFEEGYTRIS